MVAGRIITGIVAGAIVVACTAASAIGATDRHVAVRRHAPAVAGVGAFTPALGDPRLAAMLARGGIDASSFSFTPAETRRGARGVTVAVRTRAVRGDAGHGALALTAPTVGLSPIAYNLGVSVGWKKFAVAGDVSHLDMASLPGSREGADVSLRFAPNRKMSSQLRAAADRPLPGGNHLVDDPTTYSVDLSSSYSLTRNLNVTAGLRYRSDRERLARVEDDRRDSQAVYVGTAFRF